MLAFRLNIIRFFQRLEKERARARAVPSGLLYWKFSSFGQQYLQSFQKNLYRSACVPTPIYNTRVQHCAGVNITGEDAIQLNGQIKKFPKRDRVSFIRAIAFFHRILLKCFRARPFPFPPLLPPLPAFRCQPFSFFDEPTNIGSPPSFFFEFKTHSKERLNDQKFNFSSNIIEGCLFGEARCTYVCTCTYTGPYTHKRAILI